MTNPNRCDFFDHIHGEGCIKLSYLSYSSMIGFQNLASNGISKSGFRSRSASPGAMNTRNLLTYVVSSVHTVPTYSTIRRTGRQSRNIRRGSVGGLFKTAYTRTTTLVGNYQPTKAHTSRNNSDPLFGLFMCRHSFPRHDLLLPAATKVVWFYISPLV